MEFDISHYDRFLDKNISFDKGSSHWEKAKKLTFTLFNVLIDQDLRELVKVLNHYPAYIPIVCEHFRYSYNYNENEGDIVATSELLKMGEPYMTKQFARNILAKIKKIDKYDLKEIKEFINYLQEIQDDLHSLILAHYHIEIQKWIKKKKLHKLQSITIEKKLKNFKIEDFDLASSDRDKDLDIPYLA